MEAGYLGMSIDMLPFHRWSGVFSKEYKGTSVPSQQASVKEYRTLANILRAHNRVLQATPNALDKMSGVHLMRMSSGIFRKPLKTTVVAAMDLKSDESIYKLVTRGAMIGKKLFNADMKRNEKLLSKTPNLESGLEKIGTIKELLFFLVY